MWTYSKANNGTANIATPIFAATTSTPQRLRHRRRTGEGLSKNGELSAEEVYFDKTLANHHGGVVLVGDHLYGFGTGLICQNFMTGENRGRRGA